MGKKVKVVFDSNIWISIFMQKILYDEFLKARNNMSIYVSEDIILEISKVLLYPKVADPIKETNWTRKEILRAIELDSIIVRPKLKLSALEDDPEDNKILECAIAAKAGIIVSGDKHLLKLGKYKKTKILTSKDFFEYVT